MARKGAGVMVLLFFFSVGRGTSALTGRVPSRWVRCPRQPGFRARGRIVVAHWNNHARHVGPRQRGGRREHARHVGPGQLVSWREHARHVALGKAPQLGSTRPSRVPTAGGEQGPHSGGRM